MYDQVGDEGVLNFWFSGLMVLVIEIIYKGKDN